MSFKYKEKFYIAIDFDGTLTTHNAFPDIAKPNKRNIERIHRLIQNIESRTGLTVVPILWTCRCNLSENPAERYLDHAIDWCEDNVPFKFKYYNENPEQNFGHPELVQKIIADLYIDDKSFNPDYSRATVYKAWCRNSK